MTIAEGMTWLDRNPSPLFPGDFTMIRFRMPLVAALALALGFAASTASAGLRHHLKHRHDPSCCVEEPACCVEEPACCAQPCCPAPCITYKHHHGLFHKKHRHGGCCPEPTYETVLHVTSPETCCTVDVPVCLPACCEGCPVEHSRCTLFGCGEVRYDWCCGVSVKVRFKKCGDVAVTYCGF